ncbi:MAG: polysaccharide deacetylase family protein [Pseudomonadota bacterium]
MTATAILYKVTAKAGRHVRRRARPALNTVLCALLGISAVSVLPIQGIVSEAQAASCRDPNALGVHREIKVTRRTGFFLGTGKTGSIGLKPGEVVLTFDDGPREGITDRILEALAEECTKATFYVLGRSARTFPHLVKRAAREGHTIATHTQSHPFLTRHGNEKIAAELRRGMRSVNWALKGTPYKASNFFRYPYLDRSQRTDRIVKDAGLIVFDMFIDSLDWKKSSSEVMLNRVLNRLRARGSGVILFHDIQHKTARALPQFLRTLRAEGFKVVHTVPGNRRFVFGDVDATPFEPAIPRPRPSAVELAGAVGVEQGIDETALSDVIVASEEANEASESVSNEPSQPTAAETVDTTAITQSIVPENDLGVDPVEGDQAIKEEALIVASIDPAPSALPTVHIEAHRFEFTDITQPALVQVRPQVTADGPALSAIETNAPQASSEEARISASETYQENLKTVLIEDNSGAPVLKAQLREVHYSTDRDVASIDAGDTTTEADPISEPESPAPGAQETVASDDASVVVDSEIGAEKATIEESLATAELRTSIPFPRARTGPRVPLPEKRPPATVTIVADRPVSDRTAISSQTAFAETQTQVFASEVPVTEGDERRGALGKLFSVFDLRSSR